VDINKKTISLTEEAQFKSELQAKIDLLKTQRNQTLFDQEKIIKIQSFYRGSQSRRFYDLLIKTGISHQKNLIFLTMKYIIHEKESFFLRISYNKKENSIVFLVIMDGTSAETKQKLYEVYSLNELRFFSNSIPKKVFFLDFHIYINKFMYIYT